MWEGVVLLLLSWSNELKNVRRCGPYYEKLIEVCKRNDFSGAVSLLKDPGFPADAFQTQLKTHKTFVTSFVFYCLSHGYDELAILLLSHPGASPSIVPDDKTPSSNYAATVRGALVLIDAPGPPEPMTPSRMLLHVMQHKMESLRALMIHQPEVLEQHMFENMVNTFSLLENDQVKAEVAAELQDLAQGSEAYIEKHTKLLEIRERRAASWFALIHFLDSGLYSIKDRTSNVGRFFHIASKFPLELQNRLCLVAWGSPQALIPVRLVDEALATRAISCIL